MRTEALVAFPDPHNSSGVSLSANAMEAQGWRALK